MQKIHILAISGSLKSTSSNTTILKYISTLYPDTIEFSFFNDLDKLPHFNPDKEEGTHAVADLKQYIQKADGVIICTPEYAFGVPGSLKNALDWTVSTGDLNDKPVVAISASPLNTGGDKALTSLLLTLSALGTKMTEHSSLSIANLAGKIKNGEVIDDTTKEQLHLILDHLINVIGSK